MVNILNLEKLRHYAPSIFTTESAGCTSEKYKLSSTRAQYAFKYLKALIESKTKRHYTKTDPSIVIDRKYVDQVFKRYTETDLI